MHKAQLVLHTVHVCRARIYHSSKQFLLLHVTTCELYKSTLSTTFYLCVAMVSNDDSVPMSPPAVAACSDWAMELPNGCFGALHKKSDNIWSTATLPKVKYVRPTSTRDPLAMQ